MEQKVFMHRIKHLTAGTWDKGIEIKDNFEAAMQSLHAYFGAYGYGKDDTVDYVQCSITDMSGYVLKEPEVWIRQDAQPNPEE